MSEKDTAIDQQLYQQLPQHTANTSNTTQRQTGRRYFESQDLERGEGPQHKGERGWETERLQRQTNMVEEQNASWWRTLRAIEEVEMQLDIGWRTRAYAIKCNGEQVLSNCLQCSAIDQFQQHR